MLQNLAIAFPEKSERERRRIAFRSYEHFSWLILEFMRMHRLTPEQLARRIDFPQEAEFVEQFVKPERGLVLVSGHFGNWEWVIAYLARLWTRKVAVIQKRQKNRLVDLRMAGLRKRWGDCWGTRILVTGAFMCLFSGGMHPRHQARPYCT